MSGGPVSINLRGEWLVLMAAALWGIAFYFQKTAMLWLGPFTFLGLRALVAVCVLAPFAWWEWRRQPDVSVLIPALVGGVAFTTAGALQQLGLITASVTHTGLLTALYVLATPLLYWLLERRQPQWLIWPGAGMALLGVWLLSGAGWSGLGPGDGLVALATLGWGLLFVMTGRGASAPLTYTTLQFAVVAALSLLFGWRFESFSGTAILQALDSILYVGVLSTALTFGLMALAMRRLPAPRAALLLSTEVLFAAAAGWLLLGERLDVYGWLGAALIVGAVLLTRLRTP